MYRSYTNILGARVSIPENIFAEIKVAVDRHYPKECGGIFIGRIEDGKTAVIEGMQMPNTFFSSNVLFKRASGFLNKWLKKIFAKSDGDLFYLGEWHSHPNHLPVPSSTDIQAMNNIAANPNIRIETPLLLIVGYDKKKYNEIFYLFKDKTIIQYELEK